MTRVKLKEQYISYLSLLQTFNNISVIMLLHTFNIISPILDVRRGDYVIPRCESVTALKPGIDSRNCPSISVGSVGLVRSFPQVRFGLVRFWLLPTTLICGSSIYFLRILVHYYSFKNI